VPSGHSGKEKNSALDHSTYNQSRAQLYQFKLYSHTSFVTTEVFTS